MNKHFVILFLFVCMGGLLFPADILVLNLDNDFYNAVPDDNCSTDVITPLLDQIDLLYDFQFILDTSPIDSDFLAINLANYDVVFICCGSGFQTFYFTDNEAQHLRNYLNNSGGCVYMEGGNTWYIQPGDGYPDFQNDFKVTPGPQPVYADLYDISGQAGAITEGMLFRYDYNGDYQNTDTIDRKLGTGAERIFQNTPNGGGATSWVAVSYDGTTQGDPYKTIACSFEFGSLTPPPPKSTQQELLETYLDFFGIVYGGTDYGDADGDDDIDADDLTLMAAYLAGNVAGAALILEDTDLDRTGTVKARDLTILINYLVGNITQLPV